MAAATMPAISGMQSAPSRGRRRRVDAPSRASAPAMTGVPIRKAEAGSRLALEAQVQPGGDGDARAADARETGRGPGRGRSPSRRATRSCHISRIARAIRSATQSSARRRPAAAAQEQVGSRKMVSKKLSPAAPSSRAGMTLISSSQARRRSWSSPSDAALADRAEPGAQQAQHIAPEVDQQREQRARVQHHVEASRC